MDATAVTQHEANAKAVNALFAGVSCAEFSRVQGFQEAHKIWTCLENYHEGTPQVKAVTTRKIHQINHTLKFFKTLFHR